MIALMVMSGGKLEVEHAHLRLDKSSGGSGAIFNCRHIASCAVGVFDSIFEGLSEGQYVLDLCAGSAVQLHRVTMTGGTGGGLIGCAAAETISNGVAGLVIDEELNALRGADTDSNVAELVARDDNRDGGLQQESRRWRMDGRCG
eukprot:SAG31_NODE_19853_length_590_cov_0.873727_1_plen_144_part_10